MDLKTAVKRGEVADEIHKLAVIRTITQTIVLSVHVVLNQKKTPKRQRADTVTRTARAFPSSGAKILRSLEQSITITYSRPNPAASAGMELKANA